MRIKLPEEAGVVVGAEHAGVHNVLQARRTIALTPESPMHMVASICAHVSPSGLQSCVVVVVGAVLIVVVATVVAVAVTALAGKLGLMTTGRVTGRVVTGPDATGFHGSHSQSLPSTTSWPHSTSCCATLNRVQFFEGFTCPQLLSFPVHRSRSLQSSQLPAFWVAVRFLAHTALVPTSCTCVLQVDSGLSFQMPT